jgi:Cytochrome c-type biogenesis protein CcmE
MTFFKTPRGRRWTFATIVFLGSIVTICLFSLSQHSVYFYTPKEAATSQKVPFNQSIRIGGVVQTGSVEWQAKNLDLSFVLTDLTSIKIKIQHHGAPPDLFKENSGVVVEGYLSKDRKSFKAHSLFVKHSEEYRPPHTPGSTDAELIRKSMFKNET